MIYVTIPIWRPRRTLHVGMFGRPKCEALCHQRFDEKPKNLIAYVGHPYHCHKKRAYFECQSLCDLHHQFQEKRSTSRALQQRPTTRRLFTKACALAAQLSAWSCKVCEICERGPLAKHDLTRASPSATVLRETSSYRPPLNWNSEPKLDVNPSSPRL